MNLRLLSAVAILFYLYVRYINVSLGFPASPHTDIWTQGRVFVSQYAVYFYSSLFGIGTKVIISKWVLSFIYIMCLFRL